MPPEPAPSTAGAAPLAGIDEALRRFLADRRDAFEAVDPDAAAPVEEIERLVLAGGKRLRPLCCYWGYRAGGGADDGSIVQAAAALELLHTMAIVHDDVMDESTLRRSVLSTHVRLARLAEDRGFPGEPRAAGIAGAVLVGDLAAVFADRLLLEAGFPPERLAAALRVYTQMREEMGAGQWLQLSGAGHDPARARMVAALRGGRYTVDGPLLVGAALADAPDAAVRGLREFGGPLGEAFQLRDDLEDRDGPPGFSPADVSALVDRARAALDPSVLGQEACSALAAMAESVRMP